MSGTTSPDAIYYATTGDAVDPATESSLQAASVQTALDALINFCSMHVLFVRNLVRAGKQWQVLVFSD